MRVACTLLALRPLPLTPALPAHAPCPRSHSVLECAVVALRKLRGLPQDCQGVRRRPRRRRLQQVRVPRGLGVRVITHTRMLCERMACACCGGAAPVCAHAPSMCVPQEVPRSILPRPLPSPLIMLHPAWHTRDCTGAGLATTAKRCSASSCAPSPLTSPRGICRLVYKCVCMCVCA